jgi:hypothetical protein
MRELRVGLCSMGFYRCSSHGGLRLLILPDLGYRPGSQYCDAYHQEILTLPNRPRVRAILMRKSRTSLYGGMLYSFCSIKGSTLERMTSTDSVSYPRTADPQETAHLEQ